MPDIPAAPKEYQNSSPATPGQIALFARNAGFPESELTTAVAVALAESGGKVAAISPPNSNGTRDYGLWQINSVHTQLNWGSWFKGDQNAYMAKDVWDERERRTGNGWKAWSTYSSGAYIAFLPVAQVGVTAPADGKSDPGVGESQVTQEAAWFRDTKDAITQIGNAFATVAQASYKAMMWMAVPHNWVRMVIVGVGGAMTIGALVILAKPQTGVVEAVTKIPKQAVKTAAAVPTKVAKVAL